MGRRKKLLKDRVGTELWDDLVRMVRIGRHICVRLGDDEYVFWSNTVDAPVTGIMNKQEAFEFIRTSAEMLDQSGVSMRVDRLETIGTTSMMDRSAREVYEYNKAGPNGECLTLTGLRKYYAAGMTEDKWYELKLEPKDWVDLRQEVG